MALRVRNAGLSPSDGDFIVAAFDSCITFLANGGNEGLWGTQPFSQKPGFVEETYADVEKSERFRLMGEGERLRIFIAENVDMQPGDLPEDVFHRKDDKGLKFRSLGAMAIRDNEFPSHINAQEELQAVIAEAQGSGGYVFVDFIVNHFHAANQSRGAGAQLVRSAIEYAKTNEKRAVYLDCYTGGSSNLISYYQGFGFIIVVSYEVKRPNKKTNWPGVLMRADISVK